MTCRACAVVRQLALNTALLLDKNGNAVIGGDPNETLSRRTARAALAGERWAIKACAVLTWTFDLFGSNHDHCAYSLEPGSIGREVWSWSPVDAPGVMKTIAFPRKD